MKGARKENETERGGKYGGMKRQSLKSAEEKYDASGKYYLDVMYCLCAASFTNTMLSGTIDVFN